MPTVDLRCPEDPRKLLMKLQLNGDRPHVTDENLLELSCDACKARLRKTDPGVGLVLHRYNFLGELVESETIPR